MNPEAIIECVPNFSEGTDAGKVSTDRRMPCRSKASVSSIGRSTPHITVPSSPSPAALRRRGSRGARRWQGAELIDLTKQNGVHPRIGAADVIPFIPVSGASLADCAILARRPAS